MVPSQLRPTAVFVVAVAGSVLFAAGCSLVSTKPAAPLPSASVSAGTGAPSQPTPTVSGQPKPGTPASPNQPKPSPARPAALMARGATGEQVRELQHRLRQLDWFSGDITGSYRGSTVTGVKGFQKKRKLPVTGEVDQRTWNRLVAMTRKATADELHNRLRPGPAIMSLGSTGDQVRDLQARLRQIGWYSGNVTGTYGSMTVGSVREFQAKRHIPQTGEVDQRSWNRLTAMTRTPTRDEKHNIVPKPSAAGLDSRCLTGRAMCVSKRTNSLVWVVNGHPQLRVDVRFGSQELPTRNGAFAVGWKSRNHVSTIYHTSMPFAMFFSGGQAVHYSSDFAARGYNGASHGCVNVRDRQAIELLFDTVRVGDKVIVYT